MVGGMDNDTFPRRAFIAKAATITAIGFAAPHLASAADPTPSASPRPSSRIHLGLIGCGHMGRVNLSNCAAHPDVVATAACDVDENRLEPTVEQFKSTCRGFRDYREMLQQKDLDAVIIGTLPHWHTLQSIAACEAGKDLYIQRRNLGRSPIDGCETETSCRVQRDAMCAGSQDVLAWRE